MGLSYKKAGVDITKGNEFIEEIKPFVNKVNKNHMLGGIGGFGGCYELPKKGYKNPVLVSSADGVGTKLKLAFLLGKHDTVGIDLVAMNVNDIIVCGAHPLFFLDYIACGNLNVKVLKDVVKGIAKGCEQSECALAGGETAEMPSFYKKDEYDLAGFCTGAVDKKNIIDGKKVKAGNIIIGVASSGLHSNGYSLARKVFTDKELKGAIGKTLLTPTKIYVKAIKALQKKKLSIHGMGHITGGAFFEKLPRMIPAGLGAAVNTKGWNVPTIFKTIQEKGKIASKEMYRTFNMGVGLVLMVNANDRDKVQSVLKDAKYKSWIIGEVVKNKDKVILY